MSYLDEIAIDESDNFDSISKEAEQIRIGIGFRLNGGGGGGGGV